MRVHIFGPLPRQREQIQQAMPAGVKVVVHDSASPGRVGCTVAVVWASFLGSSEIAKLKKAIPNAVLVHTRSVGAVIAAAKQVAGK